MTLSLCGGLRWEGLRPSHGSRMGFFFFFSLLLVYINILLINHLQYNADLSFVMWYNRVRNQGRTPGRAQRMENKMKDKIIQLLLSDSAELTINKYCFLTHHIFRNEKGNIFEDKLHLVISISHYGDDMTEIHSRNYKEIIEIISERIKIVFSMIGEEYARRLKNGYIV